MFSVMGEDLFRVGLIVAAVSLLGCLCFWTLSLIRGKKLKAELEREYGKKRH